MVVVLSVSSGRSDVNILGPVWAALTDCPQIELHIFLTGMHCAENAAPIEILPKRAQVKLGGADLGGGEAADAAAAMGAITRDCGRICDEVRPDVMLIIGDRLDMLPAAVASLPYNIPLIHLHGGEITEGAIDDRVRHALSKLSHIHCVASQGARARLVAMGEVKERIHVTGAPGLDTLAATPLLTFEEITSSLDLPADEPYRLVTIHPETNSENPLAPCDTVLAALDSCPGPTLFTAPNSDPGGAEIKKRVIKFVDDRKWARFHDTLGSSLYPSALRHAALVLGNSSSGIIEAGLFGLPVINIGTRQVGRESGANVIDVPNDAGAVTAALKKLGRNPQRFPQETLYGSGNSAQHLAEIVANLPDRRTLLRKRLELSS